MSLSKMQTVNGAFVASVLAPLAPGVFAASDADFEKWVKPEAMAQVIGFLASAAADPIHGAALPVAGLS